MKEVILAIFFFALVQGSLYPLKLAGRRICAKYHNDYKIFATVIVMLKEVHQSGKQWSPVDWSECPSSNIKCSSKYEPICAYSKNKMLTFTNLCFMHMEAQKSGVDWHLLHTSTCEEQKNGLKSPVRLRRRREAAENFSANDDKEQNKTAFENSNRTIETSDIDRTSRIREANFDTVSSSASGEPLENSNTSDIKEISSSEPGDDELSLIEISNNQSGSQNTSNPNSINANANNSESQKSEGGKDSKVAEFVENSQSENSFGSKPLENTYNQIIEETQNRCDKINDSSKNTTASCNSHVHVYHDQDASKDYVKNSHGKNFETHIISTNTRIQVKKNNVYNGPNIEGDLHLRPVYNYYGVLPSHIVGYSKNESILSDITSESLNGKHLSAQCKEYLLKLLKQLILYVNGL